MNEDKMKYVANLISQDLEKDKEIERLTAESTEWESKCYKYQDIINELDKLIEQYSKNDYYYKYNGKYLKSEIINDLKTIRGEDK